MKKLWMFKKYIKFAWPNLKTLTHSNFSVKILNKSNLISPKKDYVSNVSKKYLALAILQFNTWMPFPFFTVHFSFVNFYYYNHQSNLGVFNIQKLVTVWLNVLTFVQNLFLFNLNYLFFSASYFKYETLSLNWSNCRYLRYLWKYTAPFTFFLNNKMSLHCKRYFHMLGKTDSKVAFVVDIYYHKWTLHYLREHKFITIGPVPISSNFYTLTITFPLASNGVFSNLFFIRLVFRLNKIISTLKFKHLKNLK